MYIKALTIINSSARTAPTPGSVSCTVNLTLATSIKLTTLTSVIRPTNVWTITAIRGETTEGTTSPASTLRSGQASANITKTDKVQREEDV